MRTRRRLVTALAAAVAAALALSACSIQIPTRNRSNLPADTMLVGADTGSPTFERVYNPYLFNRRTGANYIYEPLLMVNPLDSQDTEPWLASDYATPDPRTFTVTLRDGVAWSDGEAFTADDVVFSFELLRDNPALDLYGAWQHIDTVTAQGDDTVTFALLTDDLPAVQLIGQTNIVPEHLWADVEDPASYANEDPVGTGPYTLGRYTPQQYTMDKNPDYWQADAVAAEHLILPASNTQLDLVSKGYDWAYSFISDVEGTWGRSNAGNSWWFPPGGVIGLIPNTTVAPLGDVNFRQGLSHALDRERIADTASEGYMDPAGQTGLLLPNQQDFLDPSIPDDGLVAQDRDTALDYFEQAGYTLDGDELTGPDGQAVTLQLTTANGYTDWLRGAQEVRRQLADVGIRIEIQSPQPGGYYEAQASGDFQLLFGAFGNGNLYQGFNTLMSADFYAPIGETASGNYGRYENPAADELLAQYRSSLDPDVQKQIAYQLEAIVYSEVPAIGLYYGGLWGLFNDNRYTGWPNEDDPYTSPQTYDWSPLRLLTSLTRVQGDDS